MSTESLPDGVSVLPTVCRRLLESRPYLPQTDNHYVLPILCMHNVAGRCRLRVGAFIPGLKLRVR